MLLLAGLLLALGWAQSECLEEAPDLNDEESAKFVKALWWCSQSMTPVGEPEITNLTTVHVTPCQFSLYLDALYSASKGTSALHNLILNDAMNVDGNTQIPFLSLCDVVFGVNTLREHFDHLNHIFNPSHAGEDNEPDTLITSLVAMVNQTFCHDCSHCPGELCVLQENGRCSWNMNVGCFETVAVPTTLPTDGPIGLPHTPHMFGEGFGGGAGHLILPTAAPEAPRDVDGDSTQLSYEPLATTATIPSPSSTKDDYRGDLTEVFLIGSSIVWFGLVIYLIKTRECRSCSSFSGIGECAMHDNNMEPFLPVEHHLQRNIKPREGEVSEVESEVHFEQIEGGTFELQHHPPPPSEVVLPGSVDRAFTRGNSDASRQSGRSIVGVTESSTRTAKTSFSYGGPADDIPVYLSQFHLAGRSEYRDVVPTETDNGGAEESDRATVREHDIEHGVVNSSDEDSIASSNTPSTVIAKDTTPEANRLHPFYPAPTVPAHNETEADSETNLSDPSVILMAAHPGPILVPNATSHEPSRRSREVKSSVILARPRKATRVRRQPPPLPLRCRESDSPPRIGPGHDAYKPSPPPTRPVFDFNADDLQQILSSGAELDQSCNEPPIQSHLSNPLIQDSAEKRMQFIEGLAMDGSTESETETSIVC